VPYRYKSSFCCTSNFAGDGDCDGEGDGNRLSSIGDVSEFIIDTSAMQTMSGASGG
jgi:hypothetical protein